MSHADRFPGNEIHPSVIIEGDVRMGTGNRIRPYCVLTGPIELGDDNVIGPLVTIGEPGEVRGATVDLAAMQIRIGSRCTIREGATVQKPVHEPITQLGNDVYMMHGAHVGHDTILADGVTVAPNVVFGGHTRILRGSTFGMNATLHQFSIVGPFAMVAASAPVAKDLRPFSLFIPGKPIKVNRIGAERNGFAGQVDEISEYVLHGTAPTTASLVELVAPWEELHAASGRPVYSG